jgi:Sigma-70 region 2
MVTVNTTDWAAGEFQAHRAHLRAVAYRMLGSLTEADDAVQETWLRLTRPGTGCAAPAARAHPLIGLAIRDGKITEIDILADPERLTRLDLTV